MRSWLTTLMDVLHVLTAVVGFIVSVVEALNEGVSGVGEQKKQEALKMWTQVRDILRNVVREVLGERAASWFGFLSQDKVVSVFIDLLVAYFNRTGFFPKGK
jgi:predicted P-loop ATPase/GTPase